MTLVTIYLNLFNLNVLVDYVNNNLSEKKCPQDYLLKVRLAYSLFGNNIQQMIIRIYYDMYYMNCLMSIPSVIKVE